VCAGAAAARAANKNAKRQWEYQMEVRKRKHMQKLSIYSLAKVQYKESLDNIHKGLTSAWDRGQVRLRRVKEEVMQRNHDKMIELFQNSKFGNMLASGQQGRSVQRIGTLEKAALGRYYTRNQRALTDQIDDFMVGVKSSRDRAKTAASKEFAKVVFEPVTDVAPPKPVYQNVGLAMFSDIFGFASTVAGIASSERALKENIKQIGTAKSGLGIYKFNYIGYPDKKYIGAMVDEVEKIFPDAVGESPDNYLGVDYNKIDIEFREVA
jgi:hypothetical protein